MSKNRTSLTGPPIANLKLEVELPVAVSTETRAPVRNKVLPLLGARQDRIVGQASQRTVTPEAVALEDRNVRVIVGQELTGLAVECKGHFFPIGMN